MPRSCRRAASALTLLLSPWAWADFTPAPSHSPLLALAPPAMVLFYGAGPSDYDLTLTNVGDGPAQDVRLYVEFGTLAVTAASDPHSPGADPYFALPDLPAGASHNLHFTLENPDWCAGGLARTLRWQPRYHDGSGHDYASGLAIGAIPAPPDTPSLTLSLTAPEGVRTGETASYRVISTYAGATTGAGGSTSPVAVELAVPAGFTVTDAAGGVWTPGGGTGGRVAWSHAPAAGLDLTVGLLATTTVCGTTPAIVGSATTIDCAACARSASAAATTAITCAAAAPATKTATPAVCEDCAEIAYQNHYPFAAGANVNLNALDFTELAGEGQAYVPGSLAVTFDGDNITNCVAVTDTTPAGSLGVDFSGCPATLTDGKDLLLSYRLRAPAATGPACADQPLRSWSTLDTGAETIRSAARGLVQTPAMALTVTGLGATIDTGQSQTLTLSLARASATGAPKDATLRLSALAYHLVSPTDVVCSGDVVPVSGVPTLIGDGYWWSFGDAFSSAGQTASIQLGLRKRCTGATTLAAEAQFDDLCHDDGTPDQTCSAALAAVPDLRQGDLLLTNTPFRVSGNQVEWHTWVINRGNGTAYDVWIDHRLGAGLGFDTAAVNPSTGTAVTANQDHAGGASNGATIHIPQMAPGERREIAFVARIIDSAGDLGYQATAAWGAVGADCQTPVTTLGHVPTRVTSVLVDPGTPQRLHASLDGGIFASGDAGLSWTAVSGQPGSQRIARLVRHPTDPNRLYAAALGGGMFVSVDGGEHWRACPGQPTNPSIPSLAIDPSGRLYAGTEGGVYRSDDCLTWAADNGAWLVSAATPPVDIQIDPGAPNVLYAGLDGGGTINSGLANLNVRALAIQNSSTLFAATHDGGVFKASVSAGNWCWAACGTLPPGTRLRSLVLDAGGNLYAGSETGVFKGGSACGPWSAMNNGLAN